ncbi:MAG: peptidylprolyl isomerase, partial [Bacteroidales bacterium]|nr:peptidylprolyl isomerase [Bacteroidales bacterium]
LVRKPPISEEERQKIINELKTLKKRVEEGEDFGLMAGIYSEDPGSAKKDGEISFGRGVMDPVFEATAFDLKKPGEISDVIETQFGFHIIMLVKRSGEYITVKHILKIPKPKPKDIAQAAKDLKNIKALIEMDSLTFEEAVAKYSQDPSKKNAGKLVNPYDGSSSFTLEAMDEAVAFTVRKLKEGEVSDPVIMVTGEGIQAYRLLYLYKKREKHVINLKEDYDKIQSFALQDKQNRVMNEWIENKIKQTYVNFIDESYKKCDLSYNWIY